MATPPVDVVVRGVPELARALRRLGDNVDDDARSAFKATADQTASAIRSRVPKRSGRLASSVLGEVTDKGASVGMGDGVPYAGWIEFGGGHGRPYVASGRYVYPTARAAIPTLQRAGETAARHQIGAMHWPTPH